VETPLYVRLRDRRPAIDLGDHEHVVITGLRCTTGEVRVLSPAETGANERSLAVPAGAYGVLVCGSGFGHTDEHCDNAADRYELVLWPVDELPQPENVKDGRPSS
jgi:hypothetical protein